MADSPKNKKKTKKSTVQEAEIIETTSSKPAKRKLRASTTESIRDKAITFKANSEKKPSVFAAFWYGFFVPVRVLGRLLKRLGKFRIFRWIGYVLLPPYFRNSWKELRKVAWPNRRQSLELTRAVIIFAVIFGALVAGVDYGLDKVFKEILLKK
jgi:preprotein translocase SecE subunit